MRKIINIITIIILTIISANNICSQTVKKDSTKYRNPFYSENIVHSLNFSTIINSYKTNFNQYFDSNKSTLKKDDNVSLPLGMLTAFYRQNNNLNKALSLQRKWALEQQNLGIWGEVLQYVNAAATGYLLYEHFRKYKDKY